MTGERELWLPSRGHRGAGEEPGDAARSVSVSTACAPAPYTLGTSSFERDRLARQAADLADWSQALLDRVELRPGSRVLDVGCGPAGVLDLLADRVGPTGRVVGLDATAEHVVRARAHCADLGLHQVQVAEGDARATGLAAGSFDLAHARLVLVNIPDPEQVVTEMTRLVRPGGTVALHEAEFVAHFCDPPHPAWDRLLDAFAGVYAHSGAGWAVARRLPRLLREAGLIEVDADAHVAVRPPGHPRRSALPDLVASVRDQIVALGLLTEVELDRLVVELRTHLDDPHTFVVSHLHLQAWGRKPGSGAPDDATHAATPRRAFDPGPDTDDEGGPAVTTSHPPITAPETNTTAAGGRSPAAVASWSPTCPPTTPSCPVERYV